MAPPKRELVWAGWACCVEPKRELVWAGWACCVEPKREGVAAGWLCCALLFANKDDEVCCVLAPRAPPKRPPPLGAGVDDCAVEAPKRLPVAGPGVAGLFMLPKRPPDAGCCCCCCCVDAPKRLPDWAGCCCCGCAGVEPKRPPLLWGCVVAVAVALLPLWNVRLGFCG